MSYPWTNLSKLEIEHAALQEECDRWKALVVIGCEEDEDVKRMARPFLTDLEIDGDKYGVPGTVGIVEALCKKLKLLEDGAVKLMEELLKLKKEQEQWQTTVNRALNERTQIDKTP